ncbi:RNA polymerase sigma-B factor [Micromonospora nigra]|uniref:RNA polymerase sigma-B factor n=1 Tax=Micromonospora nigra TaxID=145857 RepID=A0A1C6S800_9ACTN|nr:SigB/SigF/SigG family RNA polymerase sigma factor [Micromonospora nigra]SCL25607.1 RNA polymerase sigma-B factor [Micromonospora nigra]
MSSIGAVRDTPTRVAGAERREQATVAAIRRLRDPRCPGGERDRLRHTVVRWNLPLARQLARRYQHRGEALDDLQQVAALALVKAVDGYDPDRGHTFTGYAVPTLLGELKRHFRDRVWSVHVPRRLQERCLEVTRARDDLTQRLHRRPSTTELAAALGISAAEVRATEGTRSAYRADSLNRPAGTDDDSCERQDLLGARDEALEAVCDRETLRAAVARLTPRARHVVSRYFYGHRTQGQIAVELGTSQMTVSRVLTRALATLRTMLSERAAEPLPTGSGHGNLRVRVYGAGRGHLIGAVGAVGAVGDVGDAAAAARLRQLLVDLARTRRPRTLTVDLRHTGRLPMAAVRALLDARRVCADVEARFCLVNVTPEVYDPLCRIGLDRLLDIRPATLPPAAGGTAAPAATADGRPTGGRPKGSVEAVRHLDVAAARRQRLAAPTRAPGVARQAFDVCRGRPSQYRPRDRSRAWRPANRSPRVVTTRHRMPGGRSPPGLPRRW